MVLHREIREFTVVFSYYVFLEAGSKPTSVSTKGPRGLHETIIYAPPLSPYNLIQEKLFTKPWQLLVATIFLNKTTGQAAIPIFWKFIELYDTPENVLQANWNDIAGTYPMII